MILADTGIWISYLHRGESELDALLETREIRMHAWVIAELALGSLRDRERYLSELQALPSLPTVTTSEVLALIERRQLYARGIGFVDTALLASCLLVPGTRLWTRDRRLAAVADELAIAA